MDIRIPEQISFSVNLAEPLDPRVIGDRIYNFDLCFTHAVKAAVLGHKIITRLVDDDVSTFCDICLRELTHGRKIPAWAVDALHKPPADVVE